MINALKCAHHSRHQLPHKDCIAAVPVPVPMQYAPGMHVDCGHNTERTFAHKTHILACLILWKVHINSQTVMPSKASLCLFFSLALRPPHPFFSHPYPSVSISPLDYISTTSSVFLCVPLSPPSRNALLIICDVCMCRWHRTTRPSIKCAIIMHNKIIIITIFPLWWRGVERNEEGQQQNNRIKIEHARRRTDRNLFDKFRNAVSFGFGVAVVVVALNAIPLTKQMDVYEMTNTFIAFARSWTLKSERTNYPHSHYCSYPIHFLWLFDRLIVVIVIRCYIFHFSHRILNPYILLWCCGRASQPHDSTAA